jgi:neutral ceramidase
MLKRMEKKIRFLPAPADAGSKSTRPDLRKVITRVPQAAWLGWVYAWRFIGCCLALLLGGLLPLAAQTKPAASAKVFRAGAAMSNVTPPLGAGIVGNFGTPPPAEHIHDQLHARCLALDDGESKLVIVTVDNVGISREVFDEAKRLVNEKTGLPKERMLMASTHTHSATSASGEGAKRRGYGQPLDEYQTFVARRIADGVRTALNNLAPARIGWGVGQVPQHLFNRRWKMKPGTRLVNPFGGQDQVLMNPGVGNPNLLEPAGPTDPQVSFLAVQNLQGRPIALLANYSLHYVGGVPDHDISADYFAVFADRIQELLKADRQDPPFVAMMSNGTSGDVNNINVRGPAEKHPPYAKMRVVANDVAQEVLRVYKTVQFRDWVRLQGAQAELTLQVRQPSPEMLAYARNVLAKPESEAPVHRHEKDYAQRTLQLQAEWPEKISVMLQAFRIGDLGIATIPFETFTQTGLDIKAKSPFKPTFTMELANGNYGYLPTPEQHKLGGYETWLGTNRVEVEASRKITAKLLELFAKLK